MNTEITDRRKALSLLAFATLGGAGALYGSYLYLGLIDTIVYAVLFGFGLTFIPTTIALFGPSLPGFIQSALGKLCLVLQMLTLGVGVFVQDKYDQWHPSPGKVDGEDVSVWFDGEWHDLGGRENLSRLGFRPFGIAWAKEAGMCREMRADAEAVADGGETDVDERGNVKRRRVLSPPDDEWLIDARVFQRFRDYARSDLLSRSEEQKLRAEANRSGVNRWASVVALGIGLFMGSALGYLMVAA